MNQAAPNTDRDSRLLAKVREGMQVYDRSGRQVGTVERIHFGRVDEDAFEDPIPPSNEAGRKLGGKDLGEILADVFDPADELEQAVQDNLLQNGFIRLTGGSLRSADRYIRSDQIEAVSGDRVQIMNP